MTVTLTINTESREVQVVAVPRCWEYIRLEDQSTVQVVSVTHVLGELTPTVKVVAMGKETRE